MMENNYYYERMREISDMTKLSFEKQAQFFQHALLVSSGTLGILIPLRASSSTGLCIRLLFLLTVLLLGLGILTTAIVVRKNATLIERARLSYLAEVQKALASDKRVAPFFYQKTKPEARLETISLWLLLSAIISLISYAVLISFLS